MLVVFRTGDTAAADAAASEVFRSVRREVPVDIFDSPFSQNAEVARVHMIVSKQIPPASRNPGLMPEGVCFWIVFGRMHIVLLIVVLEYSADR
jgi:hypothetical protein